MKYKNGWLEIYLQWIDTNDKQYELKINQIHTLHRKKIKMLTMANNQIMAVLVLVLVTAIP